MSKRTAAVVDEAYLEFETDFPQRTVSGLTRAGENVIVFRTFGRSMASHTNCPRKVLAPYAGASEYSNHGQRVVVCQRMLQAATDIFLGWTVVPVDSRHFYVRRLKDQRLADVGARLAAALPFYAALCGRTLSRAHSRAGDAVAISAYMGERNEFDKAIAEFAIAYADQTERDWRAFVDAIKAGRISASTPGRTSR
jgi:Uncharacterized protein conserved in bacteria (DUF2252)